MKKIALLLAFSLTVLVAYAVADVKVSDSVPVAVENQSNDFGIVAFTMDMNYIAPETGEVIPEFVPGTIGEPAEAKFDIFVPPKSTKKAILFSTEKIPR